MVKGSEFRKGSIPFAKFSCICGNEITSQITNVLNENTRSCGCMKLSKNVLNSTYPRLKRILNCIKARCFSKSSHSYKAYGNLGITLCDEWNNSLESFVKWSLENGYNDSLSIDRIDNSKGYSPSNCRWVTDLIQAQNKNNTLTIMDARCILKLKQQGYSLKDLARLYNRTTSSIRNIIIGKTYKNIKRNFNF